MYQLMYDILSFCFFCLFQAVNSECGAKTQLANLNYCMKLPTKSSGLCEPIPNTLTTAFTSTTSAPPGKTNIKPQINFINNGRMLDLSF